jgi:hypothetical protein
MLPTITRLPKSSDELMTAIATPAITTSTRAAFDHHPMTPVAAVVT